MGQNFLVDQSVLERIINASELSSDDRVLEIGTGLGVLTEALAKRVKHVTTIDPDCDMIKISKDVLSRYENISFIEEDFLDWEIDRQYDKVVANVPYYITSPIIEKLLIGCGNEARFGNGSRLRPRSFKRIVLTIQKEVAERIVSAPGSKRYGSFSVFVQNKAAAAIDSLISKRSFYPQPEVSSAILVLAPYEKPLYDIDEKIVRAAFSQRRKMIRSTLKKYNIDFEKIGIDPKRRAETLSLEEFERISSAQVVSTQKAVLTVGHLRSKIPT